MHKAISRTSLMMMMMVMVRVMEMMIHSDHSQFCELDGVYLGVTWTPTPKDISDPSHGRLFTFHSVYVVKGV